MVNLIFVFHNLNMDLKGPVIQKFGPGGSGVPRGENLVV